MKYFSIILLPCIFILSCSKKDNNTSQPHESIVGKWALVSDTVYTLGTSAINVKTIPGTYIQFNADGNGLEYQPAWQGEAEFNGSFTYSITTNGKTLYLNWPEIDTGNNRQEANAVTATVLQLSDHVLSLRIDETPSVGDPDNSIYEEFIHWSR